MEVLENIYESHVKSKESLIGILRQQERSAVDEYWGKTWREVRAFKAHGEAGHVPGFEEYDLAVTLEDLANGLFEDTSNQVEDSWKPAPGRLVRNLRVIKCSNHRRQPRKAVEVHAGRRILFGRRTLLQEANAVLALSGTALADCDRFHQPVWRYCPSAFSHSRSRRASNLCKNVLRYHLISLTVITKSPSSSLHPVT